MMTALKIIDYVCCKENKEKGKGVRQIMTVDDLGGWERFAYIVSQIMTLFMNDPPYNRRTFQKLTNNQALLL